MPIRKLAGCKPSQRKAPAYKARRIARQRQQQFAALARAVDGYHVAPGLWPTFTNCEVR